MFDTIAAISSGIVNQPISIIRVSGPDSFSIVKKIFSGKTGDNKSITYGYIKEDNEVIDEVLVSWFKSPNTFTGEDIVEINAHGGVINSNKILELLIINGARIAENGEFSKRAFLNGKMDLIKAEAINDMIFAKTSKQTKLAVNKFSGRTSKFINDLVKKLLNIIATIETNIDYPEYNDVEELTHNNLIPALNDFQIIIKDIIKSSEDLRYISEGINIAIVGRPNSGKSTLLNTLIEEDKAIVTDIPGTTRDIVEGTFVYNGIPIKLIDTAGIRSSSNIVEKKGIEKSLEQIKKADLIIHLVDSTIEENKYDTKIKLAASDRIYIKVFNKTDINNKKEGITISAKDKDISNLLAAISNKLPKINLDNYKMVNNSRQLALIKQSLENINSAIQNLSIGFTPDEVIVDVRLAWENLVNISGKANNEKLLDEMFKNFCLGK